MECRLCYNIDYKLVFVFDRVVFWRYENKRRDQPYSIVLLLYLLWPSPDISINYIGMMLNDTKRDRLFFMVVE